MKITAEYLKKFCSDSEIRLHLSTPFNRGEFTYATDGRILIRVPKLEVPSDQCRGADSIEEVYRLGFHLVGEWQKLPDPLPELVEPPCQTCEGKGLLSYEGGTFDDDDTPCEDCEGSGKGKVVVEVPIGSHLVDAEYLHLIKDLPDVEIRPALDPRAPLSIRFTGGTGLLMPLRPHEDRIHSSTQF